MSTVLEVGEWNPLTEEPITELKMRFVPLDLVAHWKRCGMVADFLAHFLAYNFENAAGASNIVSTVLNETLENAVKFSCDKHTKISLALRHTGEHLEIETTNIATRHEADKMFEIIKKIHAEDAELLFIQQLEHTAAIDATASGLGLISLKKDYRAGMGAKLREIDNGRCEVSFRIVLSTDEIEQRISS